ncbi:MAG TPA: cytochrome P450 [Acidimicrobiia bacterium]|nr:cytochrome P450 [Acidimicrobiia bacterium]
MAASDEWLTEHFDYLSPEFGDDIHPALGRLRELCPVAHSDRYDGYWILTRYDDVLGAAQDWESWSSEVGGGVGIKPAGMTVKAIPVHIDPPLQREYKRLINMWFTAAAVAAYEARTRELVTQLIDDFVDAGECEFQTAFAQPLPGLAFFELVLDAPPEEAQAVNHHAHTAANPGNENTAEHWAALNDWIVAFLDRRRNGPPQHDVVDAVLHAEIEGRPITEPEVIGIITLLILGGLDTTAGVLGANMIRFCEHPEIPALLRERPEFVPAAVEELLRLDGSFIGIGRTARHETELDGCPVHAGEKVYLSWASANRDETEFPHPNEFDPLRPRNRHLAFGAGPHRCAGSNLARLNLRVAIEEIVRRLADLELQIPASEIGWHTGFSRTPLRVPISFTAR